MTTAIANGSSMTYPPSARFAPVKHVMHATRGEETVLLAVRRGRYYTLNEVGSRIWALVCEGAPISTVLEQLREEYDAPAARVERDVADLLGRLEREGLITCEAR